MDPTLSIITTTHNIVESGLADDFNLMVTLLDMQTYENIEHIVIDNVSTDDTTLLMKDYKNKGYISFYSEPDTSKFDGYNKGIYRANGKYVAFMTCDDFYHDITALGDAIKLLEAENADFSFSPSYCRHPEGFTFLFVPSMLNAFQVLPCPRQCMIFKKSVLEKEGLFDIRFKYMADYDLIIRLMMKKYKGVYFPQIYTTYKYSSKLAQNADVGNKDAMNIFLKNYKNLYPLTKQLLEEMATFSKFPKELLDKLVTYFPEADRDLFYEKCEQMHQMRVDAYNKLHDNTVQEGQ